MSYANVTAHNAPPLSRQPHPDPALLNTKRGPVDNAPDVDGPKVVVVPSNFKEHPVTETSRTVLPTHDEDDHHENGSHKRKARKDKAKAALHDAEAEGLQVWNHAKRVLFQPAFAGGLLSIVNVGLIGYAGYGLYARPETRSDTKIIGLSAVGFLSLFGAETVLANAYLKTAAGQEEERRAKEEGAALYRHTREVVLRPGFLGGLAGIINVCLLGGVGYAAYAHWDKPTWDRRIVSAVSVGLLALFGGEGYLAEEYREGELLKRR